MDFASDRLECRLIELREISIRKTASKLPKFCQISRRENEPTRQPKMKKNQKRRLRQKSG